MRRTRATTAATTLIAIGTLLAASACGGGFEDDEGSDEAGGDVELRMLVNITPNLTQSWWETLVDGFEEENPGITVKIEAPVTGGVKGTLPQLLAAGDAPDIVQTLAPDRQLEPELLDLSEHEFATNSPLADLYAIDGKHYMAAVGVQMQSLVFYNKTAFADAGITEPPTTFTELEAAMQKLQDAGWLPLQTGGEWITGLGTQVFGIPSVFGANPEWYQGMRSGELTFADTYGPIVERYAAWLEQGYIAQDALGIPYADAEQSFLNGNAAMYPMGSWFAFAEQSADKDFEVGVFRAPVLDDVTTPALGVGAASPYMVMKSSEHQDEALALIEYLTTDQDAVTDQLKIDFNFRDGFDYEAGALGEELQAILDGTDPEYLVPTGDGFGDSFAPPGFANELNVQTQELFVGGTADQVIQTLDSWWESNR